MKTIQFKFQDRLLLLLNELRSSGVNVMTYAPIILAILTLRYAELKSNHSDLQNNDHVSQLNETKNILKILWPYDKNLLVKFLDRSFDKSNLNVDKEFPNELIVIFEFVKSITFETCNCQLELFFGDMFESILFQLSEMGEKNAAVSYTPREIVSLMTEVMMPQSGEAVYDPTCGSGGFLLSAWNYVQEHDKKKTLKLYGQDINLEASCIARLNMIIHGIVSAEISNGNALKFDNALREKFDVVMANPPFSVKSWRPDSPNDYSITGMYKFGLPPKSKADYAFIQHVVYSMKKKGRAAIIVNSGVLTREGVEGAIREKLIEEMYIETVIALPANIFYGTTIAAYILMLRNERSENDILFIDGTKYYKNTRGRNVLDGSAIQIIVKSCESRNSEMGKSRLVSIEEIKKNSFSLEVSRYVQEEGNDENADIDELIKKQNKLESNLHSLQKYMHQHFK